MSEQQGEFDLSQLKDKIAVVTGAGNNGIGWGLAKHAAALGMHVVIVDLHESLVRTASIKLSETFPNIRCVGIACDVTSPEAMKACLDRIDAELPTKLLGAVFANAGVLFNRTILKSTIEQWTTTFNVNVIGVVNTIQAFVPRLQKQGADAIFCTTASIGGLVRGDGGSGSYQASKHAVVSLTESLSFELARKSPHIRVHVMCPCIVESGLGTTSKTNQMAVSGQMDSAEIEPVALGTHALAMTSEDHARQVFDHIAVGNFYMLNDNTRPYVDHDFPFDGVGMIKQRFDNMLALKIDNSDAMQRGPSGIASATLKGPMFLELQRRALKDKP
jgi:NAD(P)-dependent dehydrogenase (short-subunit alcohol dehydrogenase family)